MGLPWPKKAAGIAALGAVSVTAPSLPRRSGRVAPTPRRRVAQQRLEEAVDTARGDRHQLFQARYRRGGPVALDGDQVDRLVVAERGERGLERDQPMDELEGETGALGPARRALTADVGLVQPLHVGDDLAQLRRPGLGRVTVDAERRDHVVEDRRVAPEAHPVTVRRCTGNSPSRHGVTAFWTNPTGDNGGHGCHPSPASPPSTRTPPSRDPRRDSRWSSRRPPPWSSRRRRSTPSGGSSTISRPSWHTSRKCAPTATRATGERSRRSGRRSSGTRRSPTTCRVSGSGGSPWRTLTSTTRASCASPPLPATAAPRCT